MNIVVQSEAQQQSRKHSFGGRLNLALFCFIWVLRPVFAADPADLLMQAERLTEVYNWYDAHPLYVEAEKAFRDAGDERNALFAQVSRLRGEMQIRSLADLTENIDLILATGVAKEDKQLQLRCLNVKGDIDLEVDAPAAKDDWEAVLALATEIGDRKWQSRAKGELGMIAFILGDSEGALAQVTQALLAARQSGDFGAEIRYYAAIATGLNLSRRFDQALQYFDLALNTAAKHPETGFQYISIWGKAKALLRLGRIEESERLVKEALVQADADDRRVKKVQMLIAASDIALARGATDSAIQYLKEALPIAEQGDFRRMLVAIHFNLTELSLKNQQMSDASRFAASALQLAEQVGDRYLLPSQLLLIAKVQRAEGKQAVALETLERATDIVDGLLANAGSAGRASTLIAAMSSIYTYHFELAVEGRPRTDYAFQVLERARGRVLADVISVGKPAQSDLASAERKQDERELGRLQRALLTLTKRGEREATLRKIWDVEQRMMWAEAASAPVNHAIQRERALSLRELQSGLAPAEAIVEYVFTENVLYALLISRTSSSVTKLGPRTQAEAVARGLEERLRRQGAANELMAAVGPAYRTLVAPLRGLANISKLVIVPDGPLNGLPFDVLYSASNVASTKPVISFAPSATALYALRSARARRNTDLPLLAVGDVPYESLGKRIPNPSRGGVFDAKTKPELVPLPASRTEVETAARIFAPGTVQLLGTKATEGQLKKEPLNRFAIVHLAVHGFADPQNPERAALLLAPDVSGEEDGFLQPREITALPIAAKLVVLSACNTAVGQSLGQEGVANLARAFLLAGASSVVTTLWTVGDTGSSALMNEFYDNLREGADVATALSRAKQTLLSRFGPDILPTVAAFQVVGDGSVTVGRQQNRTTALAKP